MTKLPGKPSRGSTTGKPIMVLLDVLGQKWTLRILWELQDSRITFRELRNQCDNMSPTVLNKRLKELRALSFINHNENGYGLTEQGKALSAKLLPLHMWAEEWTKTTK